MQCFFFHPPHLWGKYQISTVMLMLYWKIQQSTEALLHEVPAEPRLLFPLFTGTHLRSSSTAISCLTWWNSLAILQCSLYTWTLSFSDPQGGTGCSREERRGCQLDAKYRKTLLLKKENKKPNCHIQQLWRWICELHFPWICFCRCTTLSSLMLVSLTCLLISLMVIMVLFHNTIGLSLENIWCGIRTAATLPALSTQTKGVTLFASYNFKPVDILYPMIYDEMILHLMWPWMVEG